LSRYARKGAEEVDKSIEKPFLSRKDVPDLQRLNAKIRSAIAGLGSGVSHVPRFSCDKKFYFLHLLLPRIDAVSERGSQPGNGRVMEAELPELQGRTFYDVLSLPAYPVQLSLREIKAAYHRALLTKHPDKVSGTNGAELDLIREAWRVLSDNVLRKEYDAKLKSIVLLKL
jgi:hypothetical protein